MFQRPTPPDIDTDIIIIGAGTAGLTIAKELLNKNIDFWLLGSPYDSQLAKAGELVDTSLPDGTEGLKFIEQLFEDLKAKRINHKSSNCTDIVKSGDKFVIKTKFQAFTANRVIIATGNKQKRLGFDGEEEYFRSGISDCTVCDFPLYRNKPVAVIGNHKYTIRAAKLMRKYSTSVALLWYQSKDAPDIPDIDVYENVTQLVAFGDDSLQKVEFLHDGTPSEIRINGLFVEGEPVPSTPFLKSVDVEVEQGYISINDHFETNIKGIYAIGDITGHTSSYDEVINQVDEFLKLLLNKIEA